MPNDIEDKHDSPRHLEDAPSGLDMKVPVENDILGIRTMTSTERAEALAAAQLVDPGVSYRSRRGLTLLAILMSCLVCGTDNGFDAGAMSAINTMKPFLNFFGFKETQKSTGVIFGIYTIGGVSAFALNMTIPDILGRRKAMGICNLILVMGILLTGLSRNVAMFLVGRYFMGLGAVSASASARSYIVEIAPVQHRGVFLGFYNVMQGVGSIFVSGVSIGSGHIESTWAWRGLILLAMYGPVINICSIYFIPESPRWLYAKGYKDEAVRIITKYHSYDNDVNSPIVQIEIQEMEESLYTTGTAENWWDLRRLFNNRPNRYRMGLAAMIAVWGQTLGPASTYFTLLLDVAGVTDTNRQRILNFVNSLLQCLSGAVGAFLSDHLGRVPITLFGTGSASVGMFIIGGLLSVEENPAAARAGIAFIFLFGVFSQVAWTPINNLYSPEIMSFDIRAKGLAFQALCTQAAGLIGTFGVPAALIALNFKLYFIYGAWDAFGFALQWFFMVETKGIPLEQMQEIFEADSPTKKAKELVKAHDTKKKQGVAQNSL